MTRIPHLVFLATLALLCSASARDVQRSGAVYSVAACAHKVGPVASCHARIVATRDGVIIVGTTTPSGYGPGDLRDAYKITANGKNTTIVAAVTAYGYNNAESDLGVYRTHFGWPACTTANGCFKKLNQSGAQGPYPAQNLGWAQEAALDLDMASAMCPACQIWLIEAKTASLANLAASVDTAASLGAHAISNSYGGSEVRHDDLRAVVQSSRHCDHRERDDGGFGTPQFPASSPHVTAVGGTHLVTAANARGWTETAIGGGSCSTIYAKPAWQTDAELHQAHRRRCRGGRRSGDRRRGVWSGLEHGVGLDGVRRHQRRRAAHRRRLWRQWRHGDLRQRSLRASDRAVRHHRRDRRRPRL